MAFFGNGLASIAWSLVSTLAPARLLGLTGGVFNFIGDLAAIATPIVIGFLAVVGPLRRHTYIAVLALLGALSYILLVGKVSGSSCKKGDLGSPFWSRTDISLRNTLRRYQHCLVRRKRLSIISRDHVVSDS